MYLLKGVANQNRVIDMNRINMLSDNFALTPNGIEFLNNKPYQLPTNFLPQSVIDKMTPEELLAFKKQSGIGTTSYNPTTNADTLNNIYGNKAVAAKSRTKK